MRGQFDDPAKGVSSARDGTGTVEEGALHVHDRQRGMPQNTAQEPSRELSLGGHDRSRPNDETRGLIGVRCSEWSL
jgi:hypothetical protein